MTNVVSNDLKHASTRAQKWMEKEGINWWKSPAESPDINPIENLWHELKEYKDKPKTKEQLISENETFWGTVTVMKC